MWAWSISFLFKFLVTSNMVWRRSRTEKIMYSYVYFSLNKSCLMVFNTTFGTLDYLFYMLELEQNKLSFEPTFRMSGYLKPSKKWKKKSKETFLLLFQKEHSKEICKTISAEVIYFWNSYYCSEYIQFNVNSYNIETIPVFFFSCFFFSMEQKYVVMIPKKEKTKE